MISVGALVAYAMPTFWLGLMLIVLFSIHLNLLPSGGMTDVAVARTGVAHALDVARHLILPAITMALFYLAVYAASQWAAERARANLGPTLIEWVTLRVGAHSTSDDPSVYRPPDEAEKFPLGDPIDRLRRHLVAAGEWDEERHAALVRDVDGLVDAAFAEADSHGSVKSGVVGNPRSMFDDVYAVLPRHLVEQRERMVD